MAAETPTHLVLGGSHGIGYAYAKYWAVRGHRLVLVARNRDDLREAKVNLQSAGAKEVRCLAGDILDDGFRANLVADPRFQSLQSVLVGGPSPKPGTLFSVTPDDVRLANEICVVYPFSILSRLAKRASPPEKIILISSAAAREERCHPRFYLSGLFRRALEDLVHCLKAQSDLRESLDVWFPTVVLTRLSTNFARSLASAEPGDDAASILANHFGLPHVMSADEYVYAQLEQR